MQLQLIGKWAANGLAMHMSTEDQISPFLKTIPNDCNNSELLITKGIIEGDKSWLPTLVDNIITHLSLSIEANDHSTPTAKHTI